MKAFSASLLITVGLYGIVGMRAALGAVLLLWGVSLAIEYALKDQS